MINQIDLQTYVTPIEDALGQLFVDKPSLIKLYDPIKYSLSVGGKRIRPVCALMASELVSGSFENAINPALALEVFHNFTLVHDDVMDDAPVRRGAPTVYKKWDTNTAILSGDVMMIYASKLLTENIEPPKAMRMLSCFNQTAIEVCEGQQFDLDFETRDDVTIEEYLNMITLKTAVLLGTCFKIGAICGGADDKQCDLFYNYGRDLGVAFQLQDDLLDAYGDPEKFGKQVGGDIIANKKTYLLLLALQQGDEIQSVELQSIMNNVDLAPEAKVKAVLDVFDQLNIKDQVQQKMNERYQSAMYAVDQLSLAEEKKDFLKSIGNMLMNRTS